MPKCPPDEDAVASAHGLVLSSSDEQPYADALQLLDWVYKQAVAAASLC